MTTINKKLMKLIKAEFDIVMAEAAAAGRSLAGKPGKLKWTDKMNQDLLQCREKVLSLKS